jgi:calcineurin-like phosphoesterase family protein
MPNIWFTADFHLGHKNIIRYCNRPFDTVEEMNRPIIERLKSLVKPNDILYFLGGFCIGPKAKAWSYAARFDARTYSLCPAATTRTRAS